ncbi:MAG: hypothetical protein ACOYL6_16155 [Bacteriovoracaceae bacterium]
MSHDLNSFWEVLVIFLIPFGGGIPAGVLLAQKLKMSWPSMIILYLISDIILACVFEPILILFIRLTKDSPTLKPMREAFKVATHKTLNYYGNNNGVFALIMIAFGVDPMTGRAIAVSAGHGFVTGWLIAIAGDMIYFSILMISTLWLNDVIGDGNITMLIILSAMIAFPYLIRKFRERKQKVIYFFT